MAAAPPKTPQTRSGRQQLPKEWTVIVQQFSKAVLKQCPLSADGPPPALFNNANLYKFATEYFEKKDAEVTERKRNILKIEQVSKIYQDLVLDADDPLLNITTAELNAYIKGAGISKQVYKDLLRLCNPAVQTPPSSVNSVIFTAFCCALVPTSELVGMVETLTTVFHETPTHFKQAVRAIATIDLHNQAHLHGLEESIPRWATKVSMEELFEWYPTLMDIGAAGGTTTTTGGNNLRSSMESLSLSASLIGGLPTQPTLAAKEQRKPTPPKGGQTPVSPRNPKH
eukprot:TRINITY_DN4021_c0_g1_i1.p1 TRINITY_DN4021_c0_g1~~TRINITY_DN4021_c0_g1_i1.p1  ORF type:complete len:284 (+),score=34.64 TRINITY_DN4021_c0_g1_i1:40-891(+)